MKISAATLFAFAAGAMGAPSSTIETLRRQAPGACASAVTLDASTNVWTDYALHANSFYRAEVEAAAAEMTGAMQTAALKVADIGTFLWL